MHPVPSPAADRSTGDGEVSVSVTLSLAPGAHPVVADPSSLARVNPPWRQS